MTENLPSTEYRSPPPAEVLSGELEVGQSDGDACCHADQDAVHNKQNAVQCVLFTSPQGGEDVVQLNRDSAVERKNNTIQNCTIHVVTLQGQPDTVMGCNI